MFRSNARWPLTVEKLKIRLKIEIVLTFCILPFSLSLSLFPWFLNSLYISNFYILMIIFFFFFLFLGKKKIGIIENRNWGACYNRWGRSRLISDFYDYTGEKEKKKREESAITKVERIIVGTNCFLRYIYTGNRNKRHHVDTRIASNFYPIRRYIRL